MSEVGARGAGWDFMPFEDSTSVQQTAADIAAKPHGEADDAIDVTSSHHPA